MIPMKTLLPFALAGVAMALGSSAIAQTHDSLVIMPAPIMVTIPEGASSIKRRFLSTVRNGDQTPGGSHPIELTVTSDCPPGTIVNQPDFQPKTDTIENVATVGSGKIRMAVTDLEISSAAFTSVNRFVPQRCTLTFTADTPVMGNVDPTPSNNTVTVELNVFDHNDPEQTGVHETFIPSIHVHHPKKIRIGRGHTTKVGRYRPVLANGDLGENPGDLITLSVSDGDCPPGSVGLADFDLSTLVPEESAVVPGRSIRRGTLPVTVDSSLFYSTGHTVPGRCTVILTVSGPGGDLDSSNNTTRLVINVIDDNDF